MDGVETRELRYFVAVAEELHFGRAAARLGIAQPPLSRAIRLLERRMGTALLERTSRAVTLTRAGQVLLREARGVLDAVAAATRRTRRAGQQETRLVLTMKPGGDGGLLPAILASCGSLSDSLNVDIAFAVGDRADMLRDGRADVGLLHRPFDPLDGLDAEELLTEGQMVVLPDGHRLARRDVVRLADLRGETLARWPGSRDEPGAGPLVQDAGQLLQLIALERAIAVVPESVRAQVPQAQGLACRPVPDATPVTLVVAWPRDSRSPQVAAFVRAAVAAAHLAGREATTV